MEEQVYRRIAPHAPEAERSIIGAMMFEREAIETAREYITGDDFYDRQLGVYFDTIVELYNSGRDVDPVTVQERIKTKNLPAEYTSAEYISELVRGSYLSATAKSYAKEVQDHAVRRRLIHVADVMAADCYSGAKDVDALLDNAEKSIFDVTKRFNRGEYIPISQIVVDALHKIAEAGKTRSNVTGVPTGFSDLDYSTAGFQPSDLILVAARPSMGKSAFALSLVRYMTVNCKLHAAFFSLEMSKEQLVNRLFSMESSVGMQELRTGNLSDAEWERLVQGADILGESNLIIDETPGISVSELRSKCRKYKAEQGLDIVFIDYLQLMSASRGKAAESRQQEISAISRSLKQIARELNVPVVALSQLSRAVEARSDHRPMLSDLRESGAIEQDADVVMFLYREEYYVKDTERQGVTEVIIAKQRNGPLGTQYLRFLKENTRFVSLERERG